MSQRKATEFDPFPPKRTSPLQQLKELNSSPMPRKESIGSIGPPSAKSPPGESLKQQHKIFVPWDPPGGPKFHQFASGLQTS